MERGRDKRRLAAILAADIVGYSGLMGAYESGTIAQLKTHRKELIDPKVEEYGRRISEFYIEFFRGKVGERDRIVL